MDYIPQITVLVLILVIIGIIYSAYRKIKRKVQDFSQMAFGTNDLSEGFAKAQEEYASTPKSVSGLTSLYLPKIVKDFPDFQFNEMKDRSNNVLTSYLLAISAKDKNILSEGNDELVNQLENHITMLDNREQNEKFDRIKIHRTEINQYCKSAGRCIVTFQSSVEYYHYFTDSNGKVVNGSKTTKFQSRYNVDLIYIQNRDLIKTETDYALGVNCPNCGAPISSLGAKHCEYCGTPVIELNIKAWTFSDIKELGN